MFRRKKKADASPEFALEDVSEFALEDVFGEKLAPSIVGRLGQEGAANLAQAMMAHAKRRWIGGTLDTVFTEEEREQVYRHAHDSGTNTVESRAMFFHMAIAKKVAGEVVDAAVQTAGLPDEMRAELVVQLGALLVSRVDHRA